jgi:hypothetical protein
MHPSLSLSERVAARLGAIPRNGRHPPFALPRATLHDIRCGVDGT